MPPFGCEAVVKPADAFSLTQCDCRFQGRCAPQRGQAPSPQDHYRIVIAAAGFQEEDLELQVEKGVLTISGGKRDANEDVTYLYQGIAQRAFKLSFRLADHIEVKAAGLSNGLLSIDLLRIVPEEEKARVLPISGTDKPALEH